MIAHALCDALHADFLRLEPTLQTLEDFERWLDRLPEGRAETRIAWSIASGRRAEAADVRAALAVEEDFGGFWVEDGSFNQMALDYISASYHARKFVRLAGRDS